MIFIFSVFFPCTQMHWKAYSCTICLMKSWLPSCHWIITFVLNMCACSKLAEHPTIMWVVDVMCCSHMYCAECLVCTHCLVEKKIDSQGSVRMVGQVSCFVDVFWCGLMGHIKMSLFLDSWVQVQSHLNLMNTVERSQTGFSGDMNYSGNPNLD